MKLLLQSRRVVLVLFLKDPTTRRVWPRLSCSMISQTKHFVWTATGRLGRAEDVVRFDQRPAVGVQRAGRYRLGDYPPGMDVIVGSVQDGGRGGTKDRDALD